ncbi:MAG: hypothetical protein HQK75_14635 [Candidatus Magnetomorum sp.]|nr:hypothetical protein [Candidatus Magnetomorum sp.]
MNIELSLKNYCIQTSAKKKYEQSISHYFKQASLANDTELLNSEKEIDILKYFLENADMGHIRSKYPELNGKQNITVTLISSDQPETWQLHYHTQAVHVIWKA